MGETDRLLIFSLGAARCALPLGDIERILRAVAITPVPKAPAVVMGLVNVQGRIIPVLSIRKLFRLPENGVCLNDHLIIARTATCPVAIPVDGVLGVSEFAAQEIIPPQELFPGLDYLQGVTKLENGIILIYDIDSFLTPEEQAETLELLAQEEPHPIAAEEPEDADPGHP